ncbi:MAG: hypothetical protein FJ291_28330 [Planctomycetes bacterium]|nr:hypothetical protein [Planctomycetota bacterium]
MAENTTSGYDEIGGLKPWDQAIVVYTKATDCTGIQGDLQLPAECDVGNDESYFNFYLGVGLETEAGISFTKKAHPMKVGKIGYWKFFINPPGTDLYLGQYDEVRGRSFHLKLVVESKWVTKVWLNYDNCLQGYPASGGSSGPAKTSMALADPFGKVWYHPAGFSNLKLRFGYSGSDWREWSIANKNDLVIKRHLDTRIQAKRIFPLATTCYLTVQERLHWLQQSLDLLSNVANRLPQGIARTRLGNLPGRPQRVPGPLGTTAPDAERE